MKNSISVICFLFIISSTFAQYDPTISMQGNFKDIATFSKTGGKQLGYQGIQSYSNGVVRGSQFFYPLFANGSVTTTNNEVISNIYQFLFDKVRQELFIISKDDKRPQPEILLSDKTQIKSFMISTDKDHFFVPAHDYIPENKTDFYEVLTKADTAYTLLKFVKTNFVKLNTGDIEKMKRGDMYDEFVDKTTYYISYKMGKPTPVTFKHKSILNAFPPAKKEIIDEYFRDHDQENENEQFLINIVDEMNKK